MTRNMRKQLKVQPSYGYKHPDCGMQPPPGVQPDQTLQFALQLCSWYPAKKVSAVGAFAAWCMWGSLVVSQYAQLDKHIGLCQAGAL